jgi:ethanolamine transporter
MDVNYIIIFIMAIFAVLGAIDRCLKNRFGLGKKFEEGINALGPLALAMVGMIAISPVLAKILQPIIVPVYTFLGADPSMFAGTILANDMGGYPLAMQLAQSANAGLFAGLIVASMLGAVLVFTIPVALGIIKKEDHKFLALGILAGIITIPLGAFIGGIIAGFDVMMILANLVPIIIISLIIAFFLWKIPEKTLKFFTWFGWLILIVITLSLVVSIFQTLTNITIIEGMIPIWDGFKIIAGIAIVLAGAFPLLYIVSKLLKKTLNNIGKKIGMKERGILGMISTLANNIPMFTMLKDMTNREKVLNVAFAVSASFILGDHLGFTAAVNKEFILPMIIGKLVAGITAIILANILLSKNKYYKRMVAN